MSLHIIEPLIPGRSSAGTAEQSISHSVLDAPSFPRGSIGPRSAWQSQNNNGFAYFSADDGGTYVGITRNNRVWQDFELPMAANPASEGRPDYWLGCQYNASWFGECTLSVYLLEGQNETDLLYRQPMRGEPPQASRRALLDDPTWHELSVERIAVPAGAQRLRVVFETPNSVGLAYLYIRDVVSQLRLPPLAGDMRLTVDPDGGAIEQTGSPLLLCHGAVHRLEVKAQDGNHWQEQKLSLLWMNEDERLPVEFGVHTTPELNLNDNDHEESYQPLPALTGAHWDIHAQAQEVLSGEVTLGLGSYWQALKHELPMQVGDFRYDVVDLQWDGVVPIVELGNSTRLSAVVKSPFAPERVLAGKDVSWLLNDKPYCTVPTDEQGRAVLNYKPAPGDLGPDDRLVFKACCEDALGQASERISAIPGFLTSPWTEQLDVLFNGEPISDFDALNLRLTSIGSHTLTLRPKRAGSFFDGLPVTLQWPDGQPQLGITLSPTTAQTMTAQGVSWQIVSGMEQGTFNLEAATASLGMPLSLRGVRISASLADEVELRLAGAPVTQPALFRRGEAQTLSIVPKPGSLLGEMKLDTWLSFTDGSLVPGNVGAVPAYGSRQAFQPGGLSWALTGADLSGTFGLQIHMNGFPEPLVVDRCVLISADLADEVELTFEGDEVPEGSSPVLRRGVASRMRVAPKAGSPLELLGRAARLSFTGGSLTEDNVPAAPAYGAPRVLTSAGLDWSLTGEQVSGAFTLNVHVEGFDSSLAMSDCLLLSSHLKDEVELRFDSASVPGDRSPILRRGVASRLSLAPRQGSPLGQARLEAWLSFANGSLNPGQIVALPAYDDSRTVTDSGLDWSLTGANVSGTFGLEIRMTGFASGLQLPSCILLSQNLNDEAELRLDGPLPAPGSPRIFWRRRSRQLRMEARANSPLRQAGLHAWLQLASSLGPNQVTAAPAYSEQRALTGAGLNWSVAGQNVSGEFALEVHMDGFLAPLTLPDNILMSPDLNDEAELRRMTGDEDLKVFRREVPRTLQLYPKAGSPLFRSGLNIWMSFDQGTLSPADVSAAPNYNSRRVISYPVIWALTGRNVSGVFGLNVFVDQFEAPLNVSTCLLLSTRLEDEALLRLDGVEVANNSSHSFWRGVQRNISLVPRPGSPLRFSSLTVSPGMSGDMQTYHVKSSPSLINRRTMNTSLTWTFEGLVRTGIFSISFAGRGFTSNLHLRDNIMR
ncbi:hypothetical protein [Pseudomonas sp. microsymbiont 2]